ncbi:uncharacterized protein LACBIDRAFT_334717 [Laccaria bicolor S238N-H82]|uniref:Predicted protein n=1 Tax=Laccaria bicolor (strain S238N-H82 / ATCC MYA-4686) TaxID=486041 RepID=B0E018_LACBS|nr:uncharacterized protein LACBIDRAFT_334717 [Laccaria bicolor S238N-H82]EDQ99820.1 predicted protein [Laccaria bicolor S238N-H82]|eukprot:XP_001889512.1 predicted protein [Laccaria bicolor S238N-H82]
MPATHYAGLDISDPPSCTSTTYLATGHRLDNREPPKLDIHDRGTREDGLLVSTKSLRRVEIGVTIEQKPVAFYLNRFVGSGIDRIMDAHGPLGFRVSKNDETPSVKSWRL